MLNENKSQFNLNTLLLIILIVLVAIGLFFIIKQKPPTVPQSGTSEVSTDDTIQITPPTPAEELSLTERMEWKKSPKFGLYYPEGFELFEDYYLTPAQEESGEPKTNGVATASFSSDTVVISWGGHQSSCMDSESLGFEYGASVLACVKGLEARLGLVNVRNTLTSADLQLFGYFVMKNS